MNFLSYLLRAKTHFSLHSPFVYRLYTEVLTSRAEGAPKRRYEAMVWRLERYYGVEAMRNAGTAELRTSDGYFVVIDHPYRDADDWKGIIHDSNYQVTLDFFTVGIAITNPHLSKQHFFLR